MVGNGRNAILGFFNRRFGVPMSDGGTARLASMIGHSRALSSFMSGRRVTGKEALEIGLHMIVMLFYTNAYTRHGFQAAMQTEVMNTSRQVLAELKEVCNVLRNLKQKAPNRFMLC
ncbi:hypothetical protein CVS40_6301 [Lucilia cuprina]|nr:hypothetical protein CVS40_6301 [Lucilia cuprina]